LITENSVWNTKTTAYAAEHDASRDDPSRKYILSFINAEGVKSILEMGVGTGIFLDNLADRSIEIEYTGVDASEKFIGRTLKKHPKANIIKHDFDEVLPFGDGQFQVVYARHVLEHVKSYKILREMARVAREDVIVVLFRPLANEESVNLKEHKGTYYNSYAKADVDALCKECFREYEYFAIDDNNQPAHGPNGRNWVLHCRK